MWSLRKEIHKYGAFPSAQPPLTQKARFNEIDFQEEGGGGCTSCATLEVVIPAGAPAKRVEFTMTGDGGVYSLGLNLCQLGTDVGADISEVITATKTYRFGIDAAKISPNSFSNTIVIRVYNNATNELEDAYLHTRTHGNVNC